MTTTAVARLERAKQYLAIAESGDAKKEAYKAAAEEIAAYKEETGKTAKQVGNELVSSTRSASAAEVLVNRLLRWRKSGYQAASPYLMDEQATNRAALSHARSVLRDAPMEQVERIVADLPPERRRQVAAAAGHAYSQARVEADEERERETEAQRQARQAAGESAAQHVRRAGAGFAALGIVGHIEEARDELREMVEGATLTPEVWEEILAALRSLYEEAQVAAGVVGLDLDIEEVR